ncbi:MAG: hypothetical protein JW913_01120 [Chitinispirillaceae bacterium]|nr:hypothetical protein [Chitinispirillaceae bacterium]
MEPHTLSKSSSQDLTRTIAFLIDVHDALQENSFIEEARLVSHHLHQLSSPQFETRIEECGIEPVLEELARGFSVENTAVS